MGEGRKGKSIFEFRSFDLHLSLPVPALFCFSFFFLLVSLPSLPSLFATLSFSPPPSLSLSSFPSPFPLPLPSPFSLCHAREGKPALLSRVGSICLFVRGLQPWLLTSYIVASGNRSNKGFGSFSQSRRSDAQRGERKRLYNIYINGKEELVEGGKKSITLNGMLTIPVSDF